METEIENSEKLPWYLSDPDTEDNLLEEIISCPGCKKKQGSYREVYAGKNSSILSNGIGKSSCSFCGVDYKMFVTESS